MKSIAQFLKKKQNPAARSVFEKLDNETIFFIFKKIIREEFGSVGVGKFTPDYFNRKTLFVKSGSSVWSSELWLNRAKIIKKINQEIGRDILEEIKLK